MCAYMSITREWIDDRTVAGWEGRVYLVVEAGMLTGRIRRVALVTWRCWDRKDRPRGSEEAERSPRRASMASLWKLRLWA